MTQKANEQAANSGQDELLDQQRDRQLETATTATITAAAAAASTGDGAALAASESAAPAAQTGAGAGAPAAQDDADARSTARADDMFANAPIPQAVLKNAIPAMLAMLMVLVYNLADTFFIGQTGDAILVAAVSLGTPVFLMYMAVGTLFGAGGVSVVSRALGSGDVKRAKSANSFAIWTCLIVSIALAACVLIFMDPLLNLLGASEDTWEPTKTYLTITAFAAPFVAICECFANIIRAEGASTRAMAGMITGNVINIVMDPILILAAGWGIAGAASATLIGNICALFVYLQFYLSKRSDLGISPKRYSTRGGIATGVLSIGIPAALASILMNVSQIIANAQMAQYGDLAVSGLGVAMKVVMITGMICMGLAQGIQPLLGYCVGAKKWKRFGGVMKFSLVSIFCLGIAMAILCYAFTPQIVSVFLTDEAAADYAVEFARILLTTSFLFGVFYVLTNALQAMGAATPALIVNISRQGIIYIPMLFILQSFMGIDGLLWAQPVADVLAFGLAVGLFVYTYRKLRRADEEAGLTADESEGKGAAGATGAAATATAQAGAGAGANA